MGVYATGANVYVATLGGISISTNSGASFVNRTTAQGLGSNSVQSAYANGSYIYAATTSGLAISTDSGSTFTNRTTANGLGDDDIRAVYFSP